MTFILLPDRNQTKRVCCSCDLRWKKLFLLGHQQNSWSFFPAILQLNASKFFVMRYARIGGDFRGLFLVTHLSVQMKCGVSAPVWEKLCETFCIRSGSVLNSVISVSASCSWRLKLDMWARRVGYGSWLIFTGSYQRLLYADQWCWDSCCSPFIILTFTSYFAVRSVTRRSFWGFHGFQRKLPGTVGGTRRSAPSSFKLRSVASINN